jgi:UbiD family decarboxylase
MSFGHHPLIFRVAATEVPFGCEYQFIGAVRGEPVKVINEEITGLPMPAESEIVAVGWVPPDKKRVGDNPHPWLILPVHLAAASGRRG